MSARITDGQKTEETEDKLIGFLMNLMISDCQAIHEYEEMHELLKKAVVCLSVFWLSDSIRDLPSPNPCRPSPQQGIGTDRHLQRW
jgi:hypothetical protein